ncbi:MULTISPECIES: hypothetical protein [Snodgrassella]|uniref:hypothetical protein n=1 Tax=Snodgrassella TaxID=1193515 RepID=UPI00226A38BB|nr:hypothetical protein [Snodgrassella sp. B3088]MCX8748613.1 hypothetical protein [Snodgrassella sp. B3088]
MILPDEKIKELELQITQLRQEQENLKRGLQELLLAVMASSPDQPISKEQKRSLDNLLGEASELSELFDDDNFWLRLDNLCRNRL